MSTRKIPGDVFAYQVTVMDEATHVAVDPGAMTFFLKDPTGSSHTYAWDGTSWTNSETAIGAPSRAALGVFRLTITIPTSATHVGAWALGWRSTANVSGLGAGASEVSFNTKSSAFAS